MVKEFWKNITFTTGILIYCTFCGVLYLLSYWSTFDIDVTNFITITDVPKAFIFPFTISGALMTILFGFFSIDVTKKDFPTKITDHKFLKFITNDATISISIILIYIAALILYPIYFRSKNYWYYTSGLFIIFLIIKFLQSDLLNNYISNQRVRFIIVIVVFLLPWACMIRAKAKSLDIYFNKKIKYINIINRDKTHAIIDNNSFKLLGFLGDKLIVSSLNNEKVLILDQTGEKGVEVSEH